MVQCSEGMVDIIVLTELLKLRSCKLRSIVGDNLIWMPILEKMVLKTLTVLVTVVVDN